MKKLMDAGLLEREQRGVWAYYSLRADARRRLSGILDLEGGER
jgi:DNA-binding transcriptional ArsR family regulator